MNETEKMFAGNPCRVIREITEKDSIKYKPGLV